MPWSHWSCGGEGFGYASVRDPYVYRYKHTQHMEISNSVRFLKNAMSSVSKSSFSDLESWLSHFDLSTGCPPLVTSKGLCISCNYTSQGERQQKYANLAVCFWKGLGFQQGLYWSGQHSNVVPFPLKRLGLLPVTQHQRSPVIAPVLATSKYAGLLFHHTETTAGHEEVTMPLLILGPGPTRTWPPNNN